MRFVFLALCLFVLPAGEAVAFGDCARSGYFGNVDPRYRGVAVDCEEAEVVTIRTPEGPRDIRLVYDADYASAARDAALAQLRHGIDSSEAALLSIGEGTIDAMTVMVSGLSDDAPADEDPVAGAAEPGDGGCILVVFPEVTGRAELAYTFAHEFFHCVQYATQGRAKVKAGVSTWWAEGTAEWFAALAFPGSSAVDAFVADFDASSPETPLTSMSYDSVVFFFWVSQHFGLSMVMALIDTMPPRGSAEEQQSAVLGLLSEDDLLQFAQDYLDRRISRPGGGAIASNPFPGDIYAWDHSREHEIEAEPFVLARAQLEFSCGQWSLTRNAEEGRWKVKKEGEDWMDLPEHLEVPGPDPDSYRLAAFGPEPPGFRLELEAERDPCRGCESLAAADEEARRCLIGNWQLISGGYGEQIERMLREQGILETVEYPEFFVELSIAADGSYETGGTTPHILTVRNDDGDLHTLQGNFTYVTSGQWSVDGEELYLCEVEAHAVIDDELIDPEGNVEAFDIEGGPDSGPLLRRRDFTCAGGSLVLVEDIPMTPTVTWTYSRR